MTTALIADDEILLAEALRTELASQWPELEILAQAPHGQAAVEAALALHPQICFLDIRMPGLSGLEAAQAIAEDWPESAGALPLFVFVTAYDQYALQAFEAAAADYVLKPVTPGRLAQTVNRLRERLAPPAQPRSDDAEMQALRRLLTQVGGAPRLRHLQVSVGEAVELVSIERVIYLEAADKYLRVVCAERDYWLRLSLRELLPQLDPERFWQIHRSIIVNIDAVTRARRLENGQLQLELAGRPERLAVSRLHASRFRGH